MGADAVRRQNPHGCPTKTKHHHTGHRVDEQSEVMYLNQGIRPERDYLD